VRGWDMSIRQWEGEDGWDGSRTTADTERVWIYGRDEILFNMIPNFFDGADGIFELHFEAIM
jgi:hypothetical protein